MGVGVEMDVVLAGFVGYDCGSGSGLGAAEEVGVGVDAALEIGFVGDLEPPPEPAEPERAGAGAGAGPIFRGARPTGGALVDMTAAICCSCLLLFSPLKSLVLPCLAFSCWGDARFFLIRSIVERCVGEIEAWNEACNGRAGFGLIGATLPNPVGYRFIGRFLVSLLPEQKTGCSRRTCN